MLGLVVVISRLEAFDQFFGVKVMGATEILKGITVVAEGGVHQSDKEMGIHGTIIAKIHSV